mgnify:CR=1 FL=1
MPVASGDRIEDVDFALDANPSGRVAGRVIRADGTPIARALVVAVARRRGLTPGEALPVLGVALTDADGRYRLYVEPGAGVLGASAIGSVEPTVWWLGRTSLAAADPITVTDNGPVVGFDFTIGGSTR